MIGNYCSKFIKRSIKKLKYWLEEQDFSGSVSNGINRSYPWLNFILIDLMKKNRESLRPHYTWGVLHSAYLAKVLGIDRISVIEFGVAGGNGLLALEKAAVKIETIIGVGIDVYGFDSGRGLPRPSDYRDLPNIFSEGAHSMDFEKLKVCLTKAELILGLVEETIPEFIIREHAPVGFISFDLDFYSSTKAALQLLEGDYASLMPRIHCYFDDIAGFSYSEFTGERLAISEFNQSHEMRKIAPIYCLRHFVPKRYQENLWPEQFFMAHFFNHPLYVKPDGFAYIDTSLII